MATYQATVGLHLYYSTNKSTWTEIDGITKTPKKGGNPETVSLSIISEKFKRSLAGQQSLETFTYEFAPDFTATTGNVAVIEAMIAAGSEVWIFEEYTAGTFTAATPPVYQQGAGILYKGKPVSASLGEQSGSSAQSGEFSLDMTSSSMYIGSAGAMGSKTWVDLMSGAAATPLA